MTPLQNPSSSMAKALARADLARSLDVAFASGDTHQRLRLLRDGTDGPTVFTTSFGLEDQVLTHLIAAAAIPVRFATLDTGRMFAEIYALWAETEARYGIRVQGFYPDTVGVEHLVARQGIDGFYDGKPQREACCGVRKVEPLGRALAGASVWITGLRGSQSAARLGMAFVSHDPARDLIKANPLFDWTREQAADFAAAEMIPINPLHGRGFLSIGCAPCTRAIEPGEPERAGRWWWEDETLKECGLHVAPGGRLVRGGASA